MTAAETSLPPRETYRHGDLRRALLEAGLDLARRGGPPAIALREATRRVGVVPNAAYRHFANHDELLRAVRSVALSILADAIEAEMGRVDPGLDTATFARARLRSVGLTYLDFAAKEPGLFRTAFAIADKPTGPDEGKSKVGRLDPFELLGLVLDEMVGAGLLPPDRRPGAEFLAWSAVHGLAMLFNEGPLSKMGDEQRRAVGERLCAMVERGL